MWNLKSLKICWQSIYKKLMDNSYAIALAAALVLAFILITAAVGKIFYPSKLLARLDFVVGVFEICFTIMLIVGRRLWQVWIAAALIFASWLGYSVFWYYLELPCSCMGKLIELPKGFTIFLDLFFFFLSLWLAQLLGAKNKIIYLAFLLGFLFALMGAAFGDWVYTT